MSAGNNNEWITVTKESKKRIFRNTNKSRVGVGRRNRNNNKNIIPSTTALASSSLEELSVEEITKCLNQIILEELVRSKFFESFRSTIADATNACGRNVKKIICYGIGNFGKHSASQWQMACVIEFWKILMQKQQQQNQNQQQNQSGNNTTNNKTTNNNTTVWSDSTTTKSSITISMEYYDPCMTQNEIIYLERNGINVLSINERGKKSIDNKSNKNEMTLFFMPHCPLSLYTNVLYTNWEWLDRIIIFGNSMSAYAHRLLNQNKHVRLLQLLEPHWIEIPIPIETCEIVHRSGNFEQAFNDSSVTYFKKMVVVDKATDDKTDTTLPERPSFFEITTDSDEDEVI